MDFFNRMDHTTRTLVLDAGFILGTLVVALASFLVIRAVSGSDESPRAETAAFIATSTPTRTPTAIVVADAASATVAPTSTATPTPTATATPSPTATPSGEATVTPTPGKAPIDLDGALGRVEAYVCEPGVSTSQDDSERRAVRSWNQITEIWNRVVESEGRLNATIPAPFTLENAAASGTFLDEARRHEDVVVSAIDDLVALRAAGIHTLTREMSLSQGDFYDLERLTVQQTIAGVANNDVEEWNAAVFLEGQRTSYLETARGEMQAVCAALKQP